MAKILFFHLPLDQYQGTGFIILQDRKMKHLIVGHARFENIWRFG
jgi:hypothetical protein